MHPRTLVIFFLSLAVAKGQQPTPEIKPSQNNPGIAFEKTYDLRLIGEHWYICTSIPTKSVTPWNDDYTAVAELLKNYIDHVTKHNAAKQIVFRAINDKLKKLKSVTVNFQTTLATHASQNIKIGFNDDLVKISNTFEKSKLNKAPTFSQAEDKSYYIENEADGQLKEITQRLDNLKISALTANYSLRFDEKWGIDATYSVQNLINDFDVAILDSISILTSLTKMMQEKSYLFSMHFLKIAYYDITNLANFDAPINLEKLNAANLIKFVSPEFYSFRDQIIIVLPVPLLQTITFDLYNIITWPIIVNISSNTQVASTISTQNDFIAVEKHKNYHFFISKQNLANCNLFAEYICESRPLSIRNEICETQLVNNPSRNALVDCPRKNATLKAAYVVRTLNPSNWLYSTNDTNKIKISCADISYPLPTAGAGVITLPDGCKIISDGTLIIGQNAPNKLRNFHYAFPFFNASKLINIDKVKIQNVSPQEQSRQTDKVRDYMVTLSTAGITAFNLILILAIFMLLAFFLSKFNKLQTEVRLRKTFNENTAEQTPVLDRDFRVSFHRPLEIPRNLFIREPTRARHSLMKAIYDTPRFPARPVSAQFTDDSEDDRVTVIAFDVTGNGPNYATTSKTGTL